MSHSHPGIPSHLPPRLAISLWDFSWYTRAGVGEPFEDLDRAFDEAAARGYNTVRICAAPLYLFGNLDLPDALAISGLGLAPDGEPYGRGTRWYDAQGGYCLDLRQRFLALFAAARRTGCVVILSSWEYQQSPAFATTSTWWDAIDAIPLVDRYNALAGALGDMLDFLDAHGFGDLVAFVELHNEVDFSRLPPAGLAADSVRLLSARHPETIVTLSYAEPPGSDLPPAPDGLGLAQFHVYTYGVVGALQSLTDLREEASAGFPNDELRALLRDDAPTFEAYGTPEQWRLDATVITSQMIYGYDWIDARRWDRWLSNHFAEHRERMRADISARVASITDWASHRGLPAVIGEGWVGYTPLDGGFEESPAGRQLAELGIDEALERGAWGVVTMSNAAPHHSMWQQVDWQRRMTARILGHTPLREIAS